MEYLYLLTVKNFLLVGGKIKIDDLFGDHFDENIVGICGALLPESEPSGQSVLRPESTTVPAAPE